MTPFIEPIRTAAPSVPPVTLDDVKAHLRVEFADDDVLINQCVATAVDYVERMTGQIYISSTWSHRIARWPLSVTGERIVELPKRPVRSITSVKYRDEDDVERTLSASTYELIAGTPYLRFKAVEALPSLYRRADAVTISFVAGYGDNPSGVPADFLRPLLYIVADLYRFRETIAPGGVEALPSAVTVDRLLQNFRSPFA